MGNAPSDSKASDAEEENDDQNGINDNQVSKKEYNHQFTENHGPGKKLREKYNNFASGITILFQAVSLYKLYFCVHFPIWAWKLCDILPHSCCLRLQKSTAQLNPDFGEMFVLY